LSAVVHLFEVFYEEELRASYFRNVQMLHII